MTKFLLQDGEIVLSQKMFHVLIFPCKMSIDVACMFSQCGNTFVDLSRYPELPIRHFSAVIQKYNAFLSQSAVFTFFDPQHKTAMSWFDAGYGPFAQTIQSSRRLTQTCTSNLICWTCGSTTYCSDLCKFLNREVPVINGSKVCLVGVKFPKKSLGYLQCGNFCGVGLGEMCWNISLRVAQFFTASTSTLWWVGPWTKNLGYHKKGADSIGSNAKCNQDLSPFVHLQNFCLGIGKPA